MAYTVTIVVDGKDIVATVPLRTWEIWRRAINYIIDSGDAYMLFNEEFTRADIDEARVASGEIIDPARP